MKLLKPACVFAVLLFVLTACVPFERDGGEIEFFGYDVSNMPPELVSVENAQLRLEFNTRRGEIILTERGTGREWRSTPEITPDEMANTAAITYFQARSLFALQHENQDGTRVMYFSYRDSVRNANFEHEIISPTKMELRFTVGNVPRVFYIPDAIYRDRLYYFIEGLPRQERRAVLQTYMPFQYPLRPIYIEAGLLDRFPQLIPEPGEVGPVIYIRNDVPDHLLERAQDILHEQGYTMEDWIADMEYFNVEHEFDRPVFNIIIQMELVGNEMVVSVPFERITYNPSFIPIRLFVLPFFGYGRATDDGYLFVPDGSGALLYFDTARTTQTAFVSHVYGHDEAIIRDHLTHDDRSAFPVFGVHKNGGTFAAIIEEGASYATIRAEVAGMGGPFGRTHATFRLFHGAGMDVAGRSDRDILMHERDFTPGEQIKIRYVFTDNPGYVGMAEAYRHFLQARYPWLNNRVQQPVHAMVEILGAALSPAHIVGFPVDRPFPLTTYEQAAAMMMQLNYMGWRNVPVKMRGAHNRSIDHSVPTSLNLISQLGGRREFDNMVNIANLIGFDFYLEGEFVFMRDSRFADGFRRNRDTARQVTRRRVEHAGFSQTYFGALGTASLLADPVSLANPAFTDRTIRNFVEEAAGRGVNNIAFRSLASALAGDFHEDHHVSRETSMNMRSDLMRDLRDDGTNIWLNYGFAYGIPFANVITGMPLTDQNFNITDVSVPFIQIALHGLVPFAGRPINLAEDYSYHFLKTVESGSSLFFSFMNVPTAYLEVSRYRRYFSNEFGRWIELADQHYQRHAADFGHLYNQLIVGHEILAQGVTVTVYEDGTRVYVNTSLADFVSRDGVSVPSRRYEVRR